MTDPGSMPPQGVPTLTEVVVWPEVQRTVVAPRHAGVDTGAAIATVPDFDGPDRRRSALPSDELVVQRVLADLQRQVDLMLEYRLREALTPLLARATDSVIRDARGELASTLRDIVARAVAQEMARHRIR